MESIMKREKHRTRLVLSLETVKILSLAYQRAAVIKGGVLPPSMPPGTCEIVSREEPGC
jgi:hypothetical protein